jgi:hypothetical protein
LEAYKPYYHNTQTVLLPEFSHVGNVINLQPQGFQELATSFYDTGKADDSLFEYQPFIFKPQLSMVLLAKLLVAVAVLFPPLLVTVIVILLRRRRS